jgi:hypothetical protein
MLTETVTEAVFAIVSVQHYTRKFRSAPRALSNMARN